ncbi:MAG: GIY-YIG nuclease family protein [Lewinellaceae bacterium]|nr:GIY-YIG nuclease family protein [Lewinellaceae bacterium]
MKEKFYAIIDLETTGGRASRDKITEIAIVLHDGEKIVDKFETLINPECYIPYGITQLTGITQEMVAGAPRFFEVAKKVVEMTEGAIFVAHNVRFDYGFLKEEFARLGYAFTRKQLCTVRLSRKVFPGLGSYSLGNLIRHFDIRVDDRHRAMADALATTDLFERILTKERAESEISTLVNLGIRESKFPNHLNLEDIHALPDTCGVYYLHDQTGTVIYVGKSINIRKRIAEHFTDQTDKALKLHAAVHHISCEVTGSEMVALLLESHEIKTLHPEVNRAQRQKQFPFVIHHYVNTAGYLCFGFGRTSARERKKLNLVSEYPTLTRAKGRLESVLKRFELCSKYCGLESGKGACFHYHLHQCGGACVEAESADAYNERAHAAMVSLRTVFEEDFFLIDQGRDPGEKAVVLVENGNYCGYGYISADDPFTQENLRDAVRYRKGNPETNRIIQRVIEQNPGLIVIKCKN